MSVGLTIKDHAVTVALIEAGVLAALPLQPQLVEAPPLAKHIEMLCMLGERVWVEAESAAAFCPGAEFLEGVEIVSREKIEASMVRADVVIPF